SVSPEENLEAQMEAFSDWARTATMHILKDCPALINLKTSPTLSDPRYRSYLKLFTELQNRYSVVMEADPRHQNIRNALFRVTAGILYGAQMTPPCDLRLLRVSAPLLFMVRRGDVELRMGCLQFLGGLVGAFEGGKGDAPDGQGTAFTILYRLVRGQYPFEDKGCALLDDELERHPEVEGLKVKIISFGQQRHLRFLYSTPSGVDAGLVGFAYGSKKGSGLSGGIGREPVRLFSNSEVVKEKVRAAVNRAEERSGRKARAVKKEEFQEPVRSELKKRLREEKKGVLEDIRDDRILASMPSLEKEEESFHPFVLGMEDLSRVAEKHVREPLKQADVSPNTEKIVVSGPENLANKENISPRAHPDVSQIVLEDPSLLFKGSERYLKEAFDLLDDDLKRSQNDLVGEIFTPGKGRRLDLEKLLEEEEEAVREVERMSEKLKHRVLPILEEKAKATKDGREVGSRSGKHDSLVDRLEEDRLKAVEEDCRRITDELLRLDEGVDHAGLDVLETKDRSNEEAASGMAVAGSIPLLQNCSGSNSVKVTSTPVLRMLGRSVSVPSIIGAAPVLSESRFDRFASDQAISNFVVPDHPQTTLLMPNRPSPTNRMNLDVTQHDTPMAEFPAPRRRIDQAIYDGVLPERSSGESISRKKVSVHDLLPNQMGLKHEAQSTHLEVNRISSDQAINRDALGEPLHILGPSPSDSKAIHNVIKSDPSPSPQASKLSFSGHEITHNVGISQPPSQGLGRHENRSGPLYDPDSYSSARDNLYNLDTYAVTTPISPSMRVAVRRAIMPELYSTQSILRQSSSANDVQYFDKMAEPDSTPQVFGLSMSYLERVRLGHLPERDSEVRRSHSGQEEIQGTELPENRAPPRSRSDSVLNVFLESNEAGLSLEQVAHGVDSLSPPYKVPCSSQTEVKDDQTVEIPGSFPLHQPVLTKDASTSVSFDEQRKIEIPLSTNRAEKSTTPIEDSIPKPSQSKDDEINVEASEPQHSTGTPTTPKPDRNVSSSLDQIMSLEEIMNKEAREDRKGKVDLEAFLSGGPKTNEGFRDVQNALGFSFSPSATPKDKRGAGKRRLSPIPQTPGSPQSFSWSDASASPSQVAEKLNEEEGVTGSSLRSKSPDIGVLSGLQDNMTLDASERQNLNTMMDYSSTLVHSIRPRMQAAIDFLLRHLVFNSGTKKTEFRYTDLYSNGVAMGSLVNLGSMSFSVTLEPAMLSEWDDRDEDVPEGLHPVLREVFRLDAGMMVDLCSTLLMGQAARMAVSKEKMHPKERLRRLLSALYEVHCHLLPASRSLFNLEREMGRSLSTAQAMVVVKDQITLLRVTAKDRRESRLFLSGFQRNASNVSSKWNVAHDIENGGTTFLEWLNRLVTMSQPL
ncbi:hypothetical protein HDU67_006327, partial [Dinochytrium kinnereticum]